MDWTDRKYYLIHTSVESYQMRHKIYNSIGHIKYHNTNNYKLLNVSDGLRPYCFWQEVISCKKEDAEKLEYELNKAQRRDNNSYFMELTKLITKQ